MRGQGQQEGQAREEAPEQVEEGGEFKEFRGVPEDCRVWRNQERQLHYCRLYLPFIYELDVQRIVS